MLTRGGIALLLLSVFTLSACAPSGTVGATSPATVTETLTAIPSPSATEPDRSEPDRPDVDYKTIAVMCGAASLYQALDLFSDDVLFGGQISGMMNRNTKWYLELVQLGSELEADPQFYSPEVVEAVGRVADDFADQLPFVKELKKANNSLTWYDTWMAVVDDPGQFDSVQELLFLAGINECPLVDPWLVLPI